jgi:hypothetical protein
VDTTTVQASPGALAYQQELLGLLGDDDPAEVQAGTPALLRSLVGDAGPDLRTRPEPGEWSVLECIGHIVDAELVSSGRYRFILAHDRPDLPGYDQDAWATAFHHNEADPDELLAPFEALRAANLGLWRRSMAADRARIGMHRERGPESYELTFRMIAGHDRFHLNQAREALASIRATGDRH